MDSRAGRGYHAFMRIASGKVVGGKVVLDGAVPEDGVRVTVLVPDDGDTFALTREEKADLLARIEEADRDALLDAADVLDGLGRDGLSRRG